MHLSDRIRKCAEIVGSGDELARKSGVPRSSLETYLAGKAEPKAGRIAAICKAAGVNGHWLLTGEGPMLFEEVQAGAATSVDLRRYGDALEVLELALQKLGKTMTPAKKREAVDALYRATLGRNGADPELAAMLARLAA